MVSASVGSLRFCATIFSCNATASAKFIRPSQRVTICCGESWTRGSGRSSKTLAKYPDFRIVLVLMKPGSEMKEHHADARISIQTIQGRVHLQLPDQALELGSGELMCLESGIAHDVKAIEESAFLITVSWPGGSAEERHAMS